MTTATMPQTAQIDASATQQTPDHSATSATPEQRQRAAIYAADARRHATGARAAADAADATGAPMRTRASVYACWANDAALLAESAALAGDAPAALRAACRAEGCASAARAVLPAPGWTPPAGDAPAPLASVDAPAAA